MFVIIIGVIEYHLMDSDFRLNNVTVMLHINESGSLVHYNITSFSQVEILREERTRFQLVVPYNTYINTSIIASLCGQQHGNPTTIHLNYSKQQYYCTKYIH